MPLVALWKSAPDEIKSKSLQQLLSFAGDGQLRDGSETSIEFRDFLKHIPSSMLSEYANQCLQSAFPGSGLALQDLVNQAGIRLGFQVEEGRYRGTKNVIGFDGLWKFDNTRAILVEVKTSDTYNVNLEVIAEYRNRLIESERVVGKESSILYIVGRNDTGSLEAQVRGSRHAWDIRLISVEALFRLLSIKEEVDEDETLRRIRSVLTPQEFTRIDGIIDLVFSAASDLTPEEDNIEDGNIRPDEVETSSGDFRLDCLTKLQSHFGESLVKQTAVIYASPDGKLGLSCMFSKEYIRGGSPSYWFGFHPHQQQRLGNYTSAYVAFGCGTAELILAIPLAEFVPLLVMLNTTKRMRHYWHVVFQWRDQGLELITSGEFENVDVSKYILP